MPREKLTAALETIREELRTSADFDADTRKLLEELDNDIDAVLDSTAKAGAEPHSLVSDVEEMTARFEADHPRIGQMLREVSDALSKLGL